MKLPTLLLTLALTMPLAWGQSTAPLNSELNSSMLYELLLAEISSSNGDANSAYQLMLDAAHKGRSEQLYERAVEIALRARAGDSALQAAQDWTNDHPESRNAIRYQLQILIGLNRLQDTVEPLKRQLASMPTKERIAAINLVPRYFVRAGDKQLAARVVEQALKPEFGNSETGASAYAAVGTMRVLAGDVQGALEAANLGVTFNPQAIEPGQLALGLMDGKLPRAEAILARHLATGASPELRMAYLRKLLELQRYSDARQQAYTLTRLAPDYAEGWLVRGSMDLQEKKLEQAQAALETFVKLRLAAKTVAKPAPADDRGLAQAYFLLADIAEQRQQSDQAEHYLSLIDGPQDALRVQSRRAAQLARQGKLEEGRALIRAVPELEADDAKAKISAEVQLLRDNKQFQLVYAVLQDAVRRNPSDVDLSYDLAMAAEKIDKIGEMEILLRKLIADKPDYHNAYNALGYSLADRKLRLPEAKALIQKALEFAPEDPFIQDSLGWVEYRSGNLALAAQILQAAYQRRQDAEIAAHLGEVLWGMGQTTEARAVWSSGLKQNPENETLLATIKRLSPP
jgi:tetratricopeptide (TPR) repeat protein